MHLLLVLCLQLNPESILHKSIGKTKEIVIFTKENIESEVDARNKLNNLNNGVNMLLKFL